MRSICIDARLWGIKHTGIGRYVENLIDNLPTSSEVEVILIVHPEVITEPKLKNFKKYSARFHPYSYLAQLEMIWVLSFIRPNLLHVPHFTIPLLWPGKMVVTIHDLIKHLSRGSDTTTRHPVLYWLKYFQYLFVVWFAVHRSQQIIVPANYWKHELIKKYSLNPEKVSVTYEGVDKQFSQNSQTKISVKKPYLLYVGNLYPHKNVETLIKATEKLKMNTYIVCARSVFENRLPKSDYVHYLGRVDDPELISLYKNAQAFVFPSLIEGFGLPGLEAMAAGCPVIAARASCLPEIYGEAALFFEPKNVEDLIEKIKSLPKIRKDLIAKGLQQVKKYSWAQMANQTWQIYQHALL